MMASDRPVAATIGVFDGVHLGHRFLLDHTRHEADLLAGPMVTFTFDPHPAAVLAPERTPRLLSPLPEKLELLRQAGSGQIEVIHFDRAMSELSPEEFLDRRILPTCALRHLVIGHDFALGKGRSGDADRLAAIGAARGFQVTRLPALRHEGEVVSSTRIREALATGDLEHARSLLGRRYSLQGRVVPGAGRGRSLDVPTANLELPPDKCLPARGVYAALAHVASGPPQSPPHHAVMNHGHRPTFGGGPPVLEVHLLGYEGDLVGRQLVITVVTFLREERRFPDAAALVAQIAEDMARARVILARG